MTKEASHERLILAEIRGKPDEYLGTVNIDLYQFASGTLDLANVNPI